jgi:hypothetical protein
MAARKQPRKAAVAARPAKKPGKMYAMTLDPDLMAEVDAIAQTESRSRQAQVGVLLRLGIRHWRNQQDAA